MRQMGFGVLEQAVLEQATSAHTPSLSSHMLRYASSELPNNHAHQSPNKDAVMDGGANGRCDAASQHHGQQHLGTRQLPSGRCSTHTGCCTASLQLGPSAAMGKEHSQFA